MAESNLRITVVQSYAWDPHHQPGSLESLMTGLTAGLADKGHHVTLVALSDCDASWRNEGELFDRQVFSASSAPQALRRLAKESDVVSIHNRVDLMDLLLGSAPVGLFLHGPPSADRDWPGKFPGLQGPFDLNWDQTVDVVRQATRLAGPSAWSNIRNAAEFSTTAPFDVVYPFVHEDFINATRTNVSNPPLWLGRPVERKGLGWLVGHRASWSFPWAWAGDPSFADAALVNVLSKISAPISLARSRTEMVALMGSTNVVLAPYIQEAFGMIIPEAVATGARVVGFADAGLLESGDIPGVTLVPAGDVEAFDEAVVRALGSGVLDAVTRSSAYSRFSLTASQKAYRSHVENLLSDPHSVPQ